jgi:hypothetical protein
MLSNAYSHEAHKSSAQSGLLSRHLEPALGPSPSVSYLKADPTQGTQGESEHCNPSGDPPTAAPRCRNALISLLGTYWRASHIEANMVPLSCPSPGLEGDP